MNQRALAGLGLSLLVLAACTTADEGVAAAASETVRAELRDAGGQPVASATASQDGDRLRVRVQATGLPPGVHGVHVHAVGRCDPPDFASAGPHWNPAGRQHGSLNPQGPHMGDMPNLTVGADGRGTLEFEIPAGRVRDGAQALLDADGAALVVHASPDDYRTDPSGNSGARIACGVFG